MHYLQNGSQTSEKPPAKNTIGDAGYFTESGTNGQPSYPGADYFNAQIEEFKSVMTELGIEFNPENFNHLAQALQKLNANHKAEAHPHEQYLKSELLLNLPIYPEILTADNTFRVMQDSSAKTISVTDSQHISFRGWINFDTSTLSIESRTFSYEDNKIYHLRLDIDGKLSLNDLSNLEYNPDNLTEENRAFDSTYDSALLGLLSQGIYTPLSNTANTLIESDIEFETSSSTSNKWTTVPGSQQTLNLSRTPLSSPGIRAFKGTTGGMLNSVATTTSEAVERLGIRGKVSRYSAHLEYVYSDFGGSLGWAIVDWTLEGRV